MSKVRSLRQIRETTLIDSSVKGVHPEERSFQRERMRYKLEREIEREIVYALPATMRCYKLGERRDRKESLLSSMVRQKEILRYLM